MGKNKKKIVSCVLQSSLIVFSAFLFFMFSLYFERNADVYKYSSIYSVFKMFVDIVRTLSMITLGVLLIRRKGANIEGLKVLGFLCILTVVLNFGAYLFQMIGLLMETYYGIFDDYKIVVFITSLMYFLANLVFAGGIIFFLLKSNQNPKS